ncbi:class I SAM-dependent methyltransferase [Thermodesulfobacteriota bacterium]
MRNIKYPGKELEVFSQARNWKSYWASKITPYIGKTVLEVGAGIGSNTLLLCKDNYQRWVCLEPDARLSKQLSLCLKEQNCTSKCEVLNGTLKELSQNDLFDTILYIDVLEHIEDDKAEIDFVKRHLMPQGKLIILSPAHYFLFSKFDEAVGHYRRYDKHMLKKLIPQCYRPLKLEYLDSVGLCLSLGNSLILKRTNPSKNQIQIWDTLIIPLSKFFDSCTSYLIGKSILGVWCHENNFHPHLEGN